MRNMYAGRPAILSEAGLHSDWLVRPMLDAGFTVSRCTMDEVPHKLASGQFNVLILGRYYTLRRTRGQEALVVERLWDAVREFMRAGGGVFFGFPVGDVIPFRSWLADYDVAIPVTGLDQTRDVLIEDPSSSLGGKVYGYTTDVAEPFADGVEGIWYPVKLGHAIAARPVQTLNDAWRVVLSGGPHSRTDRDHVSHGNAISAADADAPEYASHVPLASVRAVDDGRLCVCGIPSGYNIDSPHNCPPARSFLLEGFEGKPSGMQRFLLNVFAWLAAPSLESGALGGGASDADVRVPSAPRYPDDPPVRWAAREFPPDDPRPLRGLIGARSTYSTGSSSVADYVEQARAAGLDFLVFLEEFAHLTRGALDALKAECAALSTDRFFAVPGYTIDDVAGGHYFQYGDSIRYIETDLLSDDETMLMVRPPNHPLWKMSRNDRVDSLHERVVLTDHKCRIRRGRYHHHDCPVLFEDQRACDSIALVTWQDGSVVDDVRDAYGEIEKRSLRLTPVALTLLRCAGDIARALGDGWTNRIIEPYASIPDKVLRKWMSPELEWWGMIDEERVRGPRFRFDNWQTTWPAQYMTDGPEVLAWTASVTSRDPEWRAPDVEIPPVADLFRLDPIGFRLRIKTRSAVGLAEVRLLDGERILRCWRPGGARTFEQELDLMHHQQMRLLLDVRDVRGGVPSVSTTRRCVWIGANSSAPIATTPCRSASARMRGDWPTDGAVPSSWRTAT